MPRPSLGARLYVRRRKGREPRYVILDGSKEIGKGFAVSEAGKAEAQRFLQAYLAERHVADFGNGDPRRVSVADVLDLYLEKKSPLNRRPDVDKSAIIHLANFFGENVVSDLTPDRCQEYVKWRTSMRCSRGNFKAYLDLMEGGNLCGHVVSFFAEKTPLVGSVTARRELQVLSATIGFAHKEHKLTHTVVIDMPPNGQPRDRHLTRDEAARLIKAAYRGEAKHLARFIIVALYTGTRHEAVLSLKWLRSIDSGSVDLKAGLMYRRGSKETDTSKRRPPVPLSPRLAGHLRRWHREAEAQGLVHVVTYEGRQVIRLRRSWNTARIAAKLGTDVVPHVLRHTFATWALQNGHSLTKVAAALGTSAQVVEDTYGHHVPEHLRDVVDFSRPVPMKKAR